MKYQYHDLSSEQFEDLIIGIGEELFGLGIQGFTTGVDGGRDARFEGVAQFYPSKAEPWTGITIIQAKHTSGINRSFSESDFFGNKSAKINLEVDKVKKLVEARNLDNYLLVANRKLSANINEEILDYISTETGLSKFNIKLFGINDLERYLKKFPSAVESAGLNVFDEPLKINPEDLAGIIETFANNQDVYPSPSDLLTIKEIKRKDFNTKNETNRLGEEYAKIIKDHMFKDGHYDEITSFLNHPDNISLKELYEDTAEEFKIKIITYRDKYGKFELILNYIYERLIERDPDLNRKKKLTRVFLHYMYYFCDIG